MLLVQESVNKFLEVAANLILSGNDVIDFMEVERIVECCRRKLEAAFFGKFVEPQHICRVAVRHGDAKTNVSNAQLPQPEKHSQTTIKAPGTATEFRRSLVQDLPS